MTGYNWRTVAAAAIASSVLFVGATAAQAHDEERWERERWEHRHHVHERPVYIHERPVVVERERPVYVAPPMAYSAPVPSSLNLNFNIPLQ